MPRRPLTCGAALLLAASLTTAAWGAAWEKVSWSAPDAGEKPPPGVNAIAILDRNNAYVGASDGRLLHWDGKRLKPVEHPAKVSPRKFVVNADDDVWVFGDDALSLHYDGKEWTRVDNPLSRRKASEGRLWGAGCAAPDRCFAGTRDGRLIHWDGRKWWNARSPVDRERIYAMQFSSPHAGWMVGEGFFARWDGKDWKKADVADVPRMWGAGCAAPDRCFAGTRDGRLIHWDGSKWWNARSPVDRERIYAMQFSSPHAGWMVGEGFFARWDGKDWKKADVADVPRMYDLAVIGNDWGWAVGDHGALFEYDGANWKKVDVPGSLFRLRAITCASRRACWAVGEAGAVFGWNGVRWERTRLGTPERLTAVAMRQGTALLAGDRGTLYRRVPAPAAKTARPPEAP